MYLCPPPLPPPPTTGGLIHHHTLFGDGDQLPPVRTMDGFHLLFRFFRKPVQLLLQCTHFLTQLGQPLFQSQHMFYARQVETVTRSQLLNVTQLLHIFHRVEARALGRPLGRDKPFPSYMRRVWGCISARSAAIEIMKRARFLSVLISESTIRHYPFLARHSRPHQQPGDLHHEPQRSAQEDLSLPRSDSWEWLSAPEPRDPLSSWSPGLLPPSPLYEATYHAVHQREFSARLVRME